MREFRNWVRAAREGVLEPTFVVLTTRNAWHSALESLTEWTRQQLPNAPVGGATPMLRVRSDDVETIVAEILAACAATGTG